MATQQSTHEDVLAATSEAQRTMRPQQVPVNMYEAGEALVVIAPLPAVTPADVTVEVRAATLRFWATVRSAPTREYLLHEWDYGGYERVIDLPAGYGAGLEATMANGQLAIRVLRGEPADSTVNPH